MQSNDLLLTVDVGNTNTVFGIFRNGDPDPIFHKRAVTRRDRTSDELGLFLKGFFVQEGIEENLLKKAVYSSVVPSFNPILERMMEDWFHVKPLQINYKINLPFQIRYPRPFEIGADRLVNAAACTKLFPKQKIIIVDLGTATTFCVLNAVPEYIGGVIAPGLKISMDALTKNTAQLPPIVFQQPSKILGDSTIESIQAGFFYGWVGLLREIIDEIKHAHGEDFKVVGTGGLVSSIHQQKKGVFDIIDPLLTLKGLHYLYQINLNYK
jgi:type III pantothenate kinase